MQVTGFKAVIIAIACLSQCRYSFSQSGQITGEIQIDTSVWTPVAYLTIIPEFGKMNTMSNDMIADRANIDNRGRFLFDIKYLPNEDQLIRIHISKKGDPAASLIIGGKDENFIFIVANRNSLIRIENQEQEPFYNAAVSGYDPNSEFKQINEIANYRDTLGSNETTLKAELIQSAVSEKLRFFADTCSNSLVSLYAIYKSDPEKNFPVNQQFYYNYLAKLKNDKSGYMQEFKRKIPQSRNSFLYYLVLSGIFFFVTGYVTRVLLNKPERKMQNPIHELSLQERKVFELVVMGKSNKEISESLMIGVSTVKSHINSIYSKLKINSRKEAVNLELFNKMPAPAENTEMHSN